MTNRIGPMDQGSLGKIAGKLDEARSTAKPEPGTAAPEKTVASVSSGETVNLTSSAKLLERLDKTLASLHVIDPERVDAIKSAIASGDYEIDAEAIADAMIRLDRSFGE